MRSGHGVRQYFYEYVFHQAIAEARESSAEIIPISQAKHIRSRIDTLLSERHDKTVASPDLRVSEMLGALEDALVEQVRDYEPQFGDRSAADPRYRALETQFGRITGLSRVTDSVGARLPISPYDPRWSTRSTVKRAGTSLLYIPGDTIDHASGGVTHELHLPGQADLRLYALDDGGRLAEAGLAMTDDDAAGLTELMDKMSEGEYRRVRQWVIDGGRNPRTGRIDRDRFMSHKAVSRTVAVLDELKAQGIGYSVERDREPGQLKAVLDETKLEVRLTDTIEERYAGARVYDSGMVYRYSTNRSVTGPGGSGTAIPDPSPSQAVALVRFAQGLAVEREDLPGVLVGQTGTSHAERTRGRSVVAGQVPDSYYVSKGRQSMFVASDYVTDQEVADGLDLKMMIRREADDRTLTTMFTEPQAAWDFLEQAVGSARANLEAALDVEALIDHARTEAERAEGDVDEMVPPQYSADPEIAAMQRSYWDVLTGRRADLLRPGATEAMYVEKLESIGEMRSDSNDFVAEMGNLVYGGSAEEKVRNHAEDVAYELIGTTQSEPHDVDGEWIDQRFDANRVARYMTSTTGQWSNQDNLASALRHLNIPAGELMGTGFQTTRFKDRLVTFDETTAVAIGEHDSAFMRSMGQVVQETITRNGAQVDEVMVDHQGVIRWTGARVYRNGSTEPVTGEVGQVFVPGDHGEIVTAFASGENSMIVPGYTASIAAQTPGQRPTSVEERTILRGYEQMMRERIQYQVAGDLASGRSAVGEPASVNTVYSQLYGTKHPVDFIDRNTHRWADPETGEWREQLDGWTESILSTEARRVRYSNEIKTGSTIWAEHNAENNKADPADDNTFDAWKLTGGRNMAVLTGRDSGGIRTPAGYFDPVMTGGATNQGIVRYLTADAEVGADGVITPGDTETLTGTRAPLMTRPELETLRYDPFDRQQMTASTIMQSSEVTGPTGTALMTFGGWTADDPIVISREFAERHQIRGAGGQLRDLVVGDKLSDLHGNKGVVSLVVDRNMSLEDAQEQDLLTEVRWFKENPTMDVVMSPFSLISRRNAGSARELMGGEVSTLHAPRTSSQDRLLTAITDEEPEVDAQPTPGGLSQMRFVVTHMAVDEKTKIYDDEAVLEGRGRKASGQLAWALQSQDCPAIMREFYGHNSGAEANLREYLLALGLDMDADGTLRVVGTHESLEETPARRLIEMPELILQRPRVEGGRASLNVTAMRRSFGELIGDRGGDMELPFPLTMPSGEQTEQHTSSSWKLPVLSSHVRSGQEFDDGSSVVHDYTRAYQDVFVEASKYRHMTDRIENESLSASQIEELERGRATARARAQRAYDSITSDIQSRVLEGKNNIFKTGLMASRLSDSATMVWTSDPRLDIDQVALSTVKAQQLGLSEGDHALVWRDPVLRDAGVRYMRVAIDDRLTGAAINPVMDKCFDGDFDGDAVAVVKLHTEAAKREAMEKLSVPANLLDTGVRSERGTHPFAMQVSLDTQVAISKDTFLQEGLMRLSGEANLNAVEPESGNPELDESIRERNHDGNVDLVRRLSDFYRYAQRDEFGSALSFGTREDHLRSVREVCVDTRAKGNEKSLAAYAKNLGDDQGVSGITQADQEASMFATAIKAHGTGLGGKYSQRAVKALRGTDLKAVLEVTYPVTQSILQAKHDASEARHKYAMLRGPGRALWRGQRIEHTGPRQWTPVFEDGNPVQATTAEWIDQATYFYSHADGFNVKVNPDYISRVAHALSDPATGLIRNLEEEPALAGTVMDQMAYDGSFEILLDAAKSRRSIFEGERNAQFASAGTRWAIEAVNSALGKAPTEQALDLAALRAQQPIVKSDVLADDLVGARARGSARRSTHVVGVVRPRQNPTVATQVDSPEPTNESEYEMEL